MRRFTYILAFALVILFPTMVFGADARLIIDNEEVIGLDVAPQIINDRVMVPARGVFERVGATVEWNYVHRQVTVRYNNDFLMMTINENIAWRNGEAVIMDVAPIIHNDRTLIPLRFPAEAFGFDVDWDIAGRVAIIDTGNNNSYENYYVPEEPAPQPDWQPDPIPDIQPDPPPVQDSQPDPGLAVDISSAPIQAESHPLASITALRTPRETGAMAYTIVASTAISDVDHFLLPDNRLVLDIYNARADISGPFLAYGPVSEIRSSQFSRSPYITRVVFELSIPTEFSISLSYDRQTLTIAFTQNNVSVTPFSNNYSDTFVIRGDFQPSIRVSAESNPQHLAIYVDNALVDVAGAFFRSGAFFFYYEIMQYPDGVVAVRIFMQDNWPSISVNHGVGYVSVILHHGLSGVHYDSWSRELRLSRNIIPFMDITRIQRNNEYLLNRYTLTLPLGAYGLGLGSLYAADNYINSVTVRRTSAGYAQIIFETSRVMAFTIHETHDEFIIRARRPHDIYSFIVVLDPGHGGRDPGAIGHGVRESGVVLAISHMIAERLSHHPEIKVYMTRHTDAYVPLLGRSAFANQVRADLFVSVHANAVRNRPHVSGIETWFLAHSREDDMSFTSMQAAYIIQQHMIDATGAVDRGARTTNFSVLRNTLMPAVLIEAGFLTNAQEAALLATTAHQQVLAQAIYEGILELFELHLLS